MEISHKCEICEFISDGKAHLERHIKTVHVEEKKYFECDICTIRFKSNEKLNVHIDRVHQQFSKRYQCDICDLKFTQYSKLKMHFINIHERKKFECTICNEFYDKNNLSTHIKLRHIEIDFECVLCNIRLKSKQSLDQHLATEHKIATSKIDHKCDICRKQFTQKTHLRTHMKGVHFNDRNFKCAICGKTFNNNNDVKAHMTSNHGDIPQFKCEFCEMLFNNPTRLKDHEKIIHQGIVYRCKQCGKKFQRENTFRYHLDHFHNNERLFQCDVCQLSFKSQNGLQLHVQIHSNESRQMNQYECDICAKRFYTIPNLRSHFRIHSSKVPCDQCDKYFPKMNLKQHKEIVHSGVTKVECHICGKFITNLSYNLKLHFTKLHGENSKIKIDHKCLTCNKTFKCLSGLKAHGKTHLRLENSKVQCDKCDKTFLKKDLKTHKDLVHDRSRKVECQFCGQFILKAKRDIDKHIARMHMYVEKARIEYNKCDLRQSVHKSVGVKSPSKNTRF